VPASAKSTHPACPGARLPVGVMFLVLAFYFTIWYSHRLSTGKKNRVYLMRRICRILAGTYLKSMPGCRAALNSYSGSPPAYCRCTDDQFVVVNRPSRSAARGGSVAPASSVAFSLMVAASFVEK
jgi:hypothetical protein